METKETIIHCPACTNVLARGVELGFSSPNQLSLKMKCPHCKALIKIVYALTSYAELISHA